MIVSSGTQTIFEFASPNNIPDLMENWLSLFQTMLNKKGTTKEEALTAYINLHVSFVRIHPFWDGNGRIARLVANIPVIKAGHPPIIIPNEHRQEYIEALSEYHLAAGTVTAGEELLPEFEKIVRIKKFCSESWSESIKLVEEARKKQQARA